MNLLVPVPGQEGDWSLVQPSRGKAAQKALAPAVPGHRWLSNKAPTALAGRGTTGPWGRHNQDPCQHFPFSLLGSTGHLPCTRRFQPNGDLCESSPPCRPHPEPPLSHRPRLLPGSSERSPCPGSAAAWHRRWESSHRELGRVSASVPPSAALLAAAGDSRAEKSPAGAALGALAAAGAPGLSSELGWSSWC